MVRPGHEQGLRVSPRRYRQLVDDAAHDRVVPEWLVDAAHPAWGLMLAGAPLTPSVLIRRPAPLGYARASWETTRAATTTANTATSASSGSTVHLDEQRPSS